MVFMRINYLNEAEILLIGLMDGTVVDSIDLREGIILNLDKEGEEENMSRQARLNPPKPGCFYFKNPCNGRLTTG